jgi:hypothetical protein
MCARCLEWYRKRRERHYFDGLCKCGKEPAPGYMKCPECLNYNTEYRRKLSARLKNLYRPATEEEKRKYAGITGEMVLKAYFSLFNMRIG